jgi:hypothetical protein
VIIDHRTGKVAKAEPITHGDDLTAAKSQSEAMGKAKRSLDAAASEAVKENRGCRVVSVVPSLKDGHPVADVTLVKGTEWKTVSGSSIEAKKTGVRKRGKRVPRLAGDRSGRTDAGGTS